MEVRVGERDLEEEEIILHQLEKIFMAWAKVLLKFFLYSGDVGSKVKVPLM